MYSKTIIVSHVGRDPEMRYTPSGIPVTAFSLATSRRWTDANGQPQERTTWLRVTCWRKLAELAAQYLEKGRLVLVEGEVAAAAWLDREGQPRASLELTAINVRFLGGRGAAPAGHGEPPAPEPLGSPVSEPEGLPDGAEADIPF